RHPTTRHPNLLNIEKGQVKGDSQQEGDEALRVEGQGVEVEESESSKARNSLERSFNGSSKTARIRSKTQSSGRTQKSLSRSKTRSNLRRSERLGGRSKSGVKSKERRAKSR
ncbi:hypothetical protein Tco_0844252, partial [Tanacetum coccineum]